MKFKQLLTKSLLVAAGLLVGQSVWAQTTAFSQDFTAQGESTDPTDYGFTLSYGSGSSSSLVNFTVTDGVLHCSMNNNTSGGRTGTATATFSAIGVGNEIVVSYVWSIGNATGNTNGSHTETYIGNSSGKALDIKFVGSQDNGTLYVNSVAVKSGSTSIRNTTYTVTATLNTNTKKITALTLDNSNNNFDYTASDPIDFASDISTIDRFAFENSTRQNWVNTASIDNVSITYTEARESVESFVLNYKYGENIIESENVGVTGLYCGDIYESLPFRMYILKDGVLYKTTANTSSNDYYHEKNISLVKNTVVTKNLSVVDLKGGTVVFFKDFDGSTSNNAGIRASYGSSYENTEFTSEDNLPAGKYTFMVRAYNRNRGSVVKVGDTQIFTIADVGGSWNDKTYENVIVPIAGKLALVKGASSTDPIDIIIAIKTSDIANISSYGYATFSSTNPVNVDVNGLEAYIVTDKNGNSIITEKITGDVAANTGLILKGSEGEYSLPVVASGTTYDQTSDPKNYLFACNGSYSTVPAADEGTNYVLTVQNEKVVFAPIINTPASVKAGQAALWLPASITQAKALTLSFADDVTGINSVSTKKPQAGKIYYNLQGQRVSKPNHGIYMVEGKKVFVNKLSH